MSYGECKERKMGRVRERKGVLWGVQREKDGESQGEKRCPMGSAKRERWGESGREKVSYGECKERKMGRVRERIGVLTLNSLDTV